jgi:hypothetical protein
MRFGGSRTLRNRLQAQITHFACSLYRPNHLHLALDVRMLKP